MKAFSDGPQSPRVAVGPHAADWAVEAVRQGGGDPVGLYEAPVGLIWTDGLATEELRTLLENQPTISWVQLPLAGVERMVEAGVIEGSRQWTSAKGAFAEPVAEHALTILLAGLRLLQMRARARSWGEPAGASLFDQPLTIIGAGGIATALLRLLEPFRTRVTIVRRRADPYPDVARTLGLDQLGEALSGARAVILTLALTPTTQQVIGRAEFRAMRRDAWLVNVARGGLVDTDSLVEALCFQRIGGAALDVTDPEPLPSGHPLWGFDNCLITPHTADTEKISRPLLCARITDNVQRLATGQELVGRVDPACGY